MNWEPWTGCYKASAGCDNCYFYGPNAKRFGQDEIVKTDKFDWPIRKNQMGHIILRETRNLEHDEATSGYKIPFIDQAYRTIYGIIT